MNAKMLEKRREIIKKIDALSSKCNCHTAIEFNSCPNCKEITKYGQLLLKLVNKRKSNNIVELDDFIPVKNSKVQLTKQKYLKLKSADKTDKEIAEICGVSPGTIKNWKIANNIVTERVIRRSYKKKCQ
ncbi:hypothetical protein [Lysinibacillus sp. G4S2]|uniref:hypothetical protein n=1 Tax=Lysinibacillus sp. G4S2 TaxID=3055859 RepID=UPI0025A20636|nr:hypothetical protein [Lysinibacillus sp. G4S2]MDM5245738.1 hypothetical protein [Lysinibacillus sp. G4S2]